MATARRRCTCTAWCRRTHTRRGAAVPLPLTLTAGHGCVSFHHQRIPLIVLVGGSACVGKSTLATQLAERLNLSSVLQTDVVHAVLATMERHVAATGTGTCDAGVRRQPVADLDTAYDAECVRVEHGEGVHTMPCAPARKGRPPSPHPHGLVGGMDGGGRLGGRVCQVPK
jgi:hypothetical protein